MIFYLDQNEKKGFSFPYRHKFLTSVEFFKYNVKRRHFEYPEHHRVGLAQSAIGHCSGYEKKTQVFLYFFVTVLC